MWGISGLRARVAWFGSPRLFAAPMPRSGSRANPFPGGFAQAGARPRIPPAWRGQATARQRLIYRGPKRPPAPPPLLNEAVPPPEARNGRALGAPRPPPPPRPPPAPERARAAARSADRRGARGPRPLNPAPPADPGRWFLDRRSG